MVVGTVAKVELAGIAAPAALVVGTAVQEAEVVDTVAAEAAYTTVETAQQVAEQQREAGVNYKRWGCMLEQS